MTLDSGRYFSVLARCFGVAPDTNVTAAADENKKCDKYRSNKHLVADCPLRRKNTKIVENNQNNNNQNTVENSESPEGRPRRKRKRPERLGIQTQRSKNDRIINFDSESDLELPERNSSEPISTDKLFESSGDEEENNLKEPEPENFFNFKRSKGKLIETTAINDTSQMSEQKKIHYRELSTNKFNNKYLDELQDNSPLPNEKD